MGCKHAYIAFSSLFTYKDLVTEDLISSCIVINVSSKEDWMLCSGIVTQFWNCWCLFIQKNLSNAYYVLGIILVPYNTVQW